MHHCSLIHPLHMALGFLGALTILALALLVVRVKNKARFDAILGRATDKVEDALEDLHLDRRDP